MDVVAFIQDEVVRQGFDRYTNTWAERCFWMMDAWLFAIQRALIDPIYDDADGPIEVVDVIELGKRVERDFNFHGYRKVNVYRQGMEQIGVNHENIYHLVANLVLNGDHLTPEEWYKEFEEIHPFEDGNGRVGKILYNWKNGTLMEPVLPPDFFGHGVP